jgi:dipeptidyl aminopeptidase/acylaminoacyl peptidase
LAEGLPEAAWRRRFKAPRTTLPQWANEAPDRLVYASNSTGKWELYGWDRASNTHRQLTDRREGTLDGQIDPTGENVWWFDDTDGDEFGRWVVRSFDGDATGMPVEHLGRAYNTGLRLGRRSTVVGQTTDAGSTISVLGQGEDAHTVYKHAETSWLGGLSADEALICIHHSEHGDSRHPALRVIDPRGATVAELWDGPGLGLEAQGFSEVPGDERVLVLHEREDLKRPLLWWPTTGETRTLSLDLPGDVEASWYPDGRSILLIHEHGGRSRLFRLELEGENLVEIPTQPGVIAAAAARPDGELWYQWSDAATPPETRFVSPDGRSGVVLRPAGAEAPAGVRYTDLRVGDIHAFVAQPPAGRPHPTLFLVHGGPESHDRDTFSPPVQAWVDHGLAVVLVNYRGSTGYGRLWRDALTGNPGLTELEDLAAVRQRVIDDGIADPGRIVLSGGSWGGYLTLLGLGLQPSHWTLGVAAVPVADYVAAFEDEMEPLKAYDRALFGASPSEDEERYTKRSPITYIDDVRVPTLILAGANDPRCPIRQIDNYIARLEQLGKTHEVYRFDAGHGSLRNDERIRQMEVELDFVSRHLGTTPPL